MRTKITRSAILALPVDLAALLDDGLDDLITVALGTPGTWAISLAVAPESMSPRTVDSRTSKGD
jgi:hypothetical protein